MASKRKVTVTLDEALVEALDELGALSTQLNEAAWEVVHRLRRSADLLALLEELDRTEGPLPHDPVEDARLERLLGGAA
ncbi:MAG: hypothetical protein R2755_12590 [Acidimicrobiales bacterium]